ncbi:proteoglycan 4 [Malaclemys terrapin pileata]|uniref:proteoglycan 4 n=1 Tax=Malaclemys terrapin pileata TaxID=2991368 RepID=UPI0023A79242|nr:proteoglycan 4 [Malaclemys terrapin pileata]
MSEISLKADISFIRKDSVPKLTMVWNIYYISLVLFSASLIQQASSQDLSSCAGRCGEGYSREAPCHCDYSCLHYMECCHDYKRFCTEELSCKGRCFETFVRGRECDCDADCEKFGKCCPDYQKHCEEALTTKSSSSRTAPLVTKTTAKRSSKNAKKRKPKKVVQSHEVMEEHSESEKQKSSSSSSSSLSSTTIRKTKASARNPSEKNQTNKIKNKNNRKVKDTMKEQDSKNRRTSSRTSTSDEIREISEEIGSGLDNVGTRPAPTAKRPDRKISRQGNKGTTAAPLSEESFSQTPASQPDQVTMPFKMNTTKTLSPKTNMQPTTTSVTKISALTNSAHVTKAKDTSTTAMKNATTTTAKGMTTAKKDKTTTVTTTEKKDTTTATAGETITTTDKKVTTIAERETVTPKTVTAAAKDTIKTTDKKDTTTANDEIILTPDEKDLITKKGTTTAARKTVTKAPRTDTTAEIQDTVTTADKKDTTTVDKENVLTDEKDTTTVNNEIILTPDEKDLITKKDTTTAARKTVTKAPRTDTTAEIQDTVTTADKKATTTVDKENMPTDEREKTTTGKKDTTTIGTEIVMTIAERDTTDKKDTITAERETVTTAKTATTAAAKDTVTSAAKKDTTTVGEEIILSPDEKYLTTKKDTTTAYREIVISATTATTAAARETVTRAPQTDTTTETKDTLATTGKKDTTTVDKETVMTIDEKNKTADKKDVTTIATVNIITTDEKDTIDKATTTASRATAAKKSVMTTAKLDTTAAAKKTQTTTKQTPTAAEVTTVAIELTTADKEETVDNRQKTTATEETTTEEKKELTTVIKERTTEKASDDKQATTTRKIDTTASTVTTATLTVSEEVSTTAKGSQGRPVSPTENKSGTTVTQIPPVKATAKPTIEPEKNTKSAIQITATPPINLSTSQPKDLPETKVHFETTKETSTVTKRSTATSISKETTETNDISENTYTTDTTTQKNTTQFPTEKLQTSKIIISPSLAQKPATHPVTPEQEKHIDNSSPTAINPMTLPDSNFPRRNTENPKETPVPYEGPNQNPTSSKQVNSIDYPAISFTASIVPLRGTPNPNSNDENNRLETITKITWTTTKSNSAIPQKQETTSHGITTNTSIDLVSDKEITKESPIAMNTNTSVKHSIVSSTFSAEKDMHHTSTLPSGFVTTRPEERREVTHFPTKTYSSISYSTKAPERSPTIHTDSKLQDKINTTYKDERDKNLCNGKPADGIVALPNGTLAVFRGHYYWLLDSARQPTVSPRKITEGWGIPSPIDTVFSRCNCDGKTFFFKGSQYWRFTNDVKDVGYPKQIAKGFAGLSGKIVAVLSVAQHNKRPESVYFFKRGGSVQRYIYNQEPAKKCKKKAYVRYPAYTHRAVIKRRRFERAIRSAIEYRTPVMYHTLRINHNPSGILHHEVKINSYWRGFPKVVHSAISIPNYRRPDGYDYYVFSKDQYYNVNVASRIARSVTSQTGQTVSKDWYKCPKDDL